MISLIAILMFLHLDKISYIQTTHLSIWSQRCKPKTWILNDCNWCQCDNSQKYLCSQRPCSAVDMFGHFKDAIGDIDVGMEGHGAWRSTRTVCTPGVQYRRNGILCICNEDGNWPNIACQELFRILYTVEKTELDAVTGKEKCRPNKLYLVGCNVCLCPHNGYLDQNLCTVKKCQADDPVVDKRNNREKTSEFDTKIYATCNVKKEYHLGCRKCVCLRNNKLMCNNCTVDAKVEKSYCDGKKIGSMFNMDCNTCHCDVKQNMYCSSKKCLQNGSKEIIDIINLKHQITTKFDICALNQYEKSSKSCKCIKRKDGENILDCGTKCVKKRKVHEDCVRNTLYELNCQICYCYMRSNKKRQFCVSNPICHTDKILKEKRTKELKTMHGYCEPLHTYNKDCNTCQCLEDGKTLKCTSKICQAANSVTIDSMVPVRVDTAKNCPKGHSYKVDCNVCFCLLNGNSICTTIDCRRLNK